MAVLRTKLINEVNDFDLEEEEEEEEEEEVIIFLVMIMVIDLSYKPYFKNKKS